MGQRLMIRNLFAGLLFILIMISAGCTSGSVQDQAPAAIENYLEALVAKDINTMINRSCGAWEEQARLEYESFAAVEVSLEDLGCQTSDQTGSSALVSCAGRIVASYGAEDLIIELSERRYQAVEEGSEWRMCGYE